MFLTAALCVCVFIVSSYLLPPMETDLYGEEMSSVRQSTDERETVERGDKSRPKACTQLRSCRKWKHKKNPVFSWCVLPGRGHLLARLRGESGQTCVRCNNPSSDGLRDQSIITSRENIYIRGLRSGGLRRFTAAFFPPPPQECRLVRASAGR